MMQIKKDLKMYNKSKIIVIFMESKRGPDLNDNPTY